MGRKANCSPNLSEHTRPNTVGDAREKNKEILVRLALATWRAQLVNIQLARSIFAAMRRREEARAHDECFFFSIATENEKKLRSSST